MKWTLYPTRSPTISTCSSVCKRRRRASANRCAVIHSPTERLWHGAPQVRRCAGERPTACATSESESPRRTAARWYERGGDHVGSARFGGGEGRGGTLHLGDDQMYQATHHRRVTPVPHLALYLGEQRRQERTSRRFDVNHRCAAGPNPLERRQQRAIAGLSEAAGADAEAPNLDERTFYVTVRFTAGDDQQIAGREPPHAPLLDGRRALLVECQHRVIVGDLRPRRARGERRERTQPREHRTIVVHPVELAGSRGLRHQVVSARLRRRPWLQRRWTA